MSATTPARPATAATARASSASDARPGWRVLLDLVGITSTGLIVLGAAVVGWIVARVYGGRMLFFLAYGAVVVLLIARFLSRGRLSVKASRTDIPSRLRQSQTADVTLQVTVPRRTGLFLLEERMHPHLGRTRTLPVASSGTKDLEFRYSFTPRLRGVYEVGPLVAVWSDPFGLTKRVTEVLPARQVVVHPSTEPVTDRPLTRQWEDPPVRPPISRPWPTGFEFYGMRDYVTGDDLRRVVWKAVARTGRMLTRESEQGITDQVQIVLDTARDSHSPGEPSDTFEAAVRAAASLAVRHLRDGFSVTVYGNDGLLGQPGRGERGRIPALDALAAVHRTAAPLSATLDRLITNARRDTHTIVITPRLDPMSGSRLRLMADAGTGLVVVVLDWEDSNPASLRIAGSLGAQVVVMRPLSALGPAFQASTEAMTSAVRMS
jgi:uncharacterized protein (DUF58 family)